MIHANHQSSVENSAASLALLAAGSANAAEANAFRKQHVALVRYADPISWAAVAAVNKVLKQLPSDSSDANAHNEIGIIACSLFGPMETMQRVAQSAKDGMVSPMRFPAANPGALAGVPAIVFHLRGPTLNFTLAPEESVSVVKMMANAWLTRGSATEVILLCESKDIYGESEVRCLLLGLSNETDANHKPARMRADTESVWQWWCQGGNLLGQGGELP